MGREYATFVFDCFAGLQGACLRIASALLALEHLRKTLGAKSAQHRCVSSVEQDRASVRLRRNYLPRDVLGVKFTEARVVFSVERSLPFANDVN
jgi:hypothetical protein